MLPAEIFTQHSKYEILQLILIYVGKPLFQDNPLYFRVQLYNGFTTVRAHTHKSNPGGAQE